MVTLSDFRRFSVQISAKQVPKVAHFTPNSKPMSNNILWDSVFEGEDCIPFYM